MTKSTLSTLPFITAYGQKRKISTSTPGPSRTKQSFKNECDINVIMSRYQRTGTFDFVNRLPPQYADVTGHDYQQAMDLVANARSAFEDLPSRIRSRFENDPAQLLDFVHDDANHQEALELGLLKPGATPPAPPPSKGAPAASGEPVAPAPGAGSPPPAPQK